MGLGAGSAGNYRLARRRLAAKPTPLTTMIIPHHLLSPEALNGVIEAYVMQEGTDYGEQEFSLETKVAQVQHQLEAGTAVIVYDDGDQSCSIVPKDQLSNDWKSDE